MAKALSLTVRQVSLCEVPAVLVAMQYVERYAVCGETVRELVSGCRLYVVLNDLTPVAFFSMAIESGRAHVQAAVGKCRGVRLVESVLPAVEVIARACGAKSIGMATRRRGLVRVLKKLGYEGDGGYCERVI